MSEDAERSHVVRVKHGPKRETSKTILTSDECSVYHSADGGLVVDLFRYVKGVAVESYQFRFSPADRKQLRAKV